MSDWRSSSPSCSPGWARSSWSGCASLLRRGPRSAASLDATAGHDDPLTGARLTLLGRATEVTAGDERETLLDRLVARHPGVGGYRGFGDFRLYRVEPEAAHLVAGFGVIHWLPAKALVPPEASQTLEERHDGIVDHMNEDHADALQAIAAGAGEDPAVAWRLVQLDAEALLLAASGRELWVPWPAPVSDAEAARTALIHLTKEGRRKLAPERG